MALTDEEANSIKKHLLTQLDNFPRTNANKSQPK